jgi:hypothetical protein
VHFIQVLDDATQQQIPPELTVIIFEYAFQPSYRAWASVLSHALEKCTPIVLDGEPCWAGELNFQPHLP